MVAKLLVQAQDGTPEQICFADHATDFSPASAEDMRDGNELDVQLDTTSLADAAARMSAKFNFGTNRAPLYGIRAAVEMAATPTTGELIELYMGYSQSATAATANPAGLTGSDAAYSGYSSNLAASVLQLHLIGTVKVTVQTTGTIQQAYVGIFAPRAQYGILVVKNESAAAFHSDAVETHIVFDPIVPESQ